MAESAVFTGVVAFCQGASCWGLSLMNTTSHRVQMVERPVNTVIYSAGVGLG
jgi:hypothetical protein